ncbi:MAG TPA: hypothetical protein V6D48_07500 [Oculatellaceae cyanobacterium]
MPDGITNRQAFSIAVNWDYPRVAQKNWQKALLGCDRANLDG